MHRNEKADSRSYHQQIALKKDGLCPTDFGDPVTFPLGLRLVRCL